MRAQSSARVGRLLWLVALLLGGGVLAMAGGRAGASLRQPASVIANGGGAAAGASLREPLSVVGQATEGGVSASLSYRNTDGFVPPAGASPGAGAEVWVVQ